jgi:sugar phosphate isomerase/epimerase
LTGVDTNGGTPSPLLALAAGSLLDASAVALVRAAAAAGFDAVGLRLSGEHSLDGRAVADMQRLLDDLGLVLWDVEVHRIGSGADPGRLIDTAAALGARHLLVVSDLPEAAATRHALAEVSERCRAAGVTAALEYMAWTTPSDPLEAGAMAAATDAVVICDVLHHVRVGAGPRELAALAGSGRLGWVQLCDAPLGAPPDLVHEARHGRLPPGEGHLPLGDLLAALPAECPRSVEVQSDRLSATLNPAERAVLLHRAAQPWNTIGYRPK